MIDYASNLPPRMDRLPKDSHGRPVPWFVAWVDDKPDFRVVGPGKLDKAIDLRLCWACGQPLGGHKAFVIGPMCAVNRTTAEPPCHRDCAIYCASHCDFLVNPKRGRRELSKDLKAQAANPAGVAIMRNPGVSLVWVTKHFGMFGDGQGGRLFDIGEPEGVHWFAQGREASRAEALAAIDSGFPLLEAECDKERTESLKQQARDQLSAYYQRAMRLLPAA